MVHFVINHNTKGHEFYLSRHGQSEYNAIGRIGGDSGRYAYLYQFMYMYMCVCPCVCVMCGGSEGVIKVGGSERPFPPPTHSPSTHHNTITITNRAVEARHQLRTRARCLRRRQGTFFSHVVVVGCFFVCFLVAVVFFEILKNMKL